MLRYFYLLCLLLCIRDNFCYEYISDHDSYSSRRAGQDARLKHRKLKGGRRFMKRHDYDLGEDRDPVAQIDVADFIQNPDYETVDENSPYIPQYNKNERLYKDYNYGLPSLNIESNVDKRSHDYIYSGSNQMDDNPSLYKNMINPQHNLNARDDRKTDSFEDLTKYPNEFLIDNSAVHKPIKKCSLKHMIPFFSHKKSGTTKSKKIKKRRLFCFNCSNKTKIVSSTPVTVEPNPNMNKNLYKINKRSYNEGICPLCRRKFTTKNEKESSKKSHKSSRMIHNSRQFYQDLNNIGKNIPSEVDGYRIDNEKIEEMRSKRDGSTYDQDKERQIKELEEVQKKIDNLEILVPGKKRSAALHKNSNVS